MPHPNDRRRGLVLCWSMPDAARFVSTRCTGETPRPAAATDGRASDRADRACHHPPTCQGIYVGRLWGGGTCALTQHRHARAARETQQSHTKTACIDFSYADTAQVRDAPVSVSSVPISARMSWTRCAGSGVRRRYHARECWKSECVHDTPKIEPTARKRYVTPDAGAASIGSTDKTSATSVTVSVLP